MAGIDISGYDPWSSVGGDMSGSVSPGGGSVTGSPWSSAGAALGSTFGPIGGSIGGLLGGAVGKLFGGGSDDHAAKQARAAAIEQMAFQERMSNTAMYRHVVDLKKSGLNPMLAGLNQQGASTPSGAMPSVFSSGVAKANSALRGAEVGNQIGMSFATIANKLADAQLASASALESQARLPTYQADIAEKYNRIDLNDTVQRKTVQDIYESMARENLSDVQAGEIVKGKIPLLLRQVYNVDADTALKMSEKVLKDLDIPRMRAEANMYRRTGGDLIPYVEPLSKVINSIGIAGIGSAVNALRGGRASVFQNSAHPSNDNPIVRMP